MKTFKNKKRAAWLMAAVMMGTFTFAGMAMQTTYAAVPTKTLVHDSQMKNATIQDLDNDTRVFAVDKTIEVKKVTFQNRLEGKSGTCMTLTHQRMTRITLTSHQFRT